MIAKAKGTKQKKATLYAVLPLRDVVVPPRIVIPLFIGRSFSIKALEAVAKEQKPIFAVAQTDPMIEQPVAQDLYRVGTIVNLLQILKLPDGTLKVLVEGEQRAEAVAYFDGEQYIEALLKPLAEENDHIEEIAILKQNLLEYFEQHLKLNKKISSELLPSVSAIEDTGCLVDTIAAHLPLKLNDKQQLLEEMSVYVRLEKLVILLQHENELLHLDHKVRSRVKKQMERSQKEYYLNEQIKAIQRELGDGDGQDFEDLAQKIKKARMPEEVSSIAKVELSKLRMMSPMSAEASVSRNYIEWLCKMPWINQSEEQHDLRLASKCLDEEHYGLEKIKERILEYLAVQTRVKKQKGSILCLVGPPGVGKTSLGKSIAKATGREFVRISLGGIRDEAEIRGHRRTYIGAMPGKILQRMAKVKVKNPLFLLDEIDKMSTDFRGDPASALLEVLDPEQNATFNDHYLEVDFDLSEVMFIATANSLNIPAPLLDRMELIQLGGYTEDEKVKIAINHLIPKELQQHGLIDHELHFSESAVRSLIQHYTREAGVRNLDRELAKISRKVVRELSTPGKKKATKLSARQLKRYLGAAKFRYQAAETIERIGVVTGLAWTEAGGDTLMIETVVVPGTGKIQSTGKLGEVMKESVQAAISVVRARAIKLGIVDLFYKESDIHVHAPEGGVPKDGPSAGAAICTALVSSLTGIAVRPKVAMTGEITLRGEILPIGGLKEKLLAARRAGIDTVLIPAENQRNLEEIEPSVYAGITVHQVRWIDEVFKLALMRMPVESNPTPVAETTTAASTSFLPEKSSIEQPWHG